MEKHIVERFNDEVVQRGATLFGVPPDRLTQNHGSMNFICEYQIGGENYILRFTPSEHRSLNMVRGELEWLLYLHEHGVSVSIPVASSEGNLAEFIGHRDCGFTVTSFVKAGGESVPYPDCLHDAELYYKCGVAVGRLHAVSKSYVPSTAVIQRKDWRHNFYLTNIRQFVPQDQVQVFGAWLDVIRRLEDLPVDPQSFGLTHGDVHVGNFTVDESDVILFDFDEAQYSWFINDIVTQMYYLVYVYGGDNGKELRESQAKRFLEHFKKGYDEEHIIDDYWISQIPLFLRLREIIVYVGMYKNQPDISELNQWGKDFMAEAKVRIENGVPIVDIWS